MLRPDPTGQPQPGFAAQRRRSSGAGTAAPEDDDRRSLSFDDSAAPTGDQPLAETVNVIDNHLERCSARIVRSAAGRLDPRPVRPAIDRVLMAEPRRRETFVTQLDLPPIVLGGGPGHIYCGCRRGWPAGVGRRGWPA